MGKEGGRGGGREKGRAYLVLTHALGHHVEDISHNGRAELKVEVRLRPLLCNGFRRPSRVPALRGREGGREGGKEGGWSAHKEEGREGKRKEGRQVDKEGGRQVDKEGGREGGREGSYLELTREKVTQPPFQERHNATQEEQPHAPARCPEP